MDPQGEEAMSEAGVLEITDESFDAEVLNSETPAIFDFWA